MRSHKCRQLVCKKHYNGGEEQNPENIREQKKGDGRVVPLAQQIPAGVGDSGDQNQYDRSGGHGWRCKGCDVKSSLDYEAYTLRTNMLSFNAEETDPNQQTGTAVQGKAPRQCGRALASCNCSRKSRTVGAQHPLLDLVNPSLTPKLAAGSGIHCHAVNGCCSALLASPIQCWNDDENSKLSNLSRPSLKLCQAITSSFQQTLWQGLKFTILTEQGKEFYDCQQS